MSENKFNSDLFEEMLTKADDLANTPGFAEDESNDFRAKGGGTTRDIYEKMTNHMQERMTSKDEHVHERVHKWNKEWPQAPSTQEEENIFLGFHTHSPDNPLGLHSHVPGGPLTGGHTHSPENPLGAHHHSESPKYMKHLDGKHRHERVGAPDGGHAHLPENFA
jgi:hypothetical protein